ncbi:MAG: hypothetical protein AB7L13_07500 [Acidimicrobiia bacterium]
MAKRPESDRPGSMALVGPMPPGRPEPVREGPQAFLAVLPGGKGPLRTHFHRVDQFQFVVYGEATMANHPVHFGHLHFSDRFQPYGPIQPGDDGLTFLTLRARTGGGVFYMPDSQPDLAGGLAALPESPGDRRNLVFDLTVEHGVLADHPDGLRVETMSAASHESIPEFTVEGAGAYVVVLSGTVDNGNEAVGTGSIAWLDAGTTVKAQRAGCDGAQLVLLQYPVKPALAMD